MTAPLTVACVWVEGEFAYGPEYVSRLHAMCARWLEPPFQFVCLSDRPHLVPPPAVAIPVEKLPGFAPWTKLELFNPARAWPGRVLYLDLDVLVVRPLAAVVDARARFAITHDPSPPARPRRVDTFGRAIVRKFNSSVMAWDGGTQTDLYTDWTPDVAARLSGDQDWIGERRRADGERAYTQTLRGRVPDPRPVALALPRAWFPRLSELAWDAVGMPRLGPAVVVLAKVPKNAEAAARWPWVRETWA